VIRWREQIREQSVAIQCIAFDDSPSAVFETCRQAWLVVRDELLPRHAELGWDALRVEVWTDTARTVVFPVRRSAAQRIDVAVVEVIWPRLYEVWETAEGDPNVSDEEFAARIEPIVQTILDALQAAFHETAWDAAFAVECYRFEKELLRVFGRARLAGA
jgi:hypothetical protein